MNSSPSGRRRRPTPSRTAGPLRGLPTLLGPRPTRAPRTANAPGSDLSRSRPLPTSPRTTHLLGTLSALTLLATSTAACTSTGSHTDASMAALPEKTPPSLSKYYEQKLSWRSCGGEGFQCATMKAPLDYEQPSRGHVELAVSRKKATANGRRQGSLLVNPGGPGASAIGYLQSYAALGYPAKVRGTYDMVALDPRGVGRSEPVTCLDAKGMDAYVRTDVTPDSKAEQDALVAAYKKFAQGCERRSAELLPHMSTVEAARDMDMLRALLGDRRLNYVGASYGTFLGATYAGLFPDRVGRLVLDGAMDPALSARRMNQDQTAGFETAFQSFAKDCVRRPDCPLGPKGTALPKATANLAAFFERADAKPLRTSSKQRPLTEALATTGVIAAMYDEAAWSQLRAALNAAMKKKDGTSLLALSDSYYQRETDGKYTNLMYANAAVNCLDLPPAFGSPDEVTAALPTFEKASPVFGRGLAWSALNCSYWPTKPTGKPRRIEARGAAPILVVGTTRDPATPYGWARSLATQLDSATLLTYEGDGHTAYNRGSACVDAAVNTYLTTGRAPRENTHCS
ncbi:alpha/beta fold hydrolase [Streptomyces sp. NA04227]|uniref:alpha/beta hydrolase n=1 Tax=Streptomyces sp. NA04227 TaxID=2742136 RepID=UPI001591EC1D|nr:alpha/beta hydrolase [Streptomyces sp. NA04227]QKW07344.1 alpha/beta fold hydrolase [Streptomyces sp. NA04227]